MKRSATLLLLLGVLVLVMITGCQEVSRYQSDNQISSNQTNVDEGCDYDNERISLYAGAECRH